MAYFDERELIDLIRHELRIEDDLGFTTKIIQPPNRRAKYGGLPLNFRQSIVESDIEEEEDYFCEQQFQILEAEPKGSTEIIESRMRSRTVESDKSLRIDALQRKSNEECPVLIRIPHSVTKIEPAESELSKQIDKNLKKFQNPLNEFSKFKGMPEARSSQFFKIRFPPVNKSSVEIEVCVVPTAMVFEFVGLCCLQYFLYTSAELPGKVEDYSLHIVDEDTDQIDQEFPPLEKNRVVCDLGFPILALVRTEEAIIIPKFDRKMMVTVFFTSGEQFGIEIPRPSTNISWLCKEALRRWREARKNLTELMPDAVYIVESLDHEGRIFSDETYVSTCGCSDFVVYRKNSSRVGFNPRKPMLLSSQVSIVCPTSPALSTNRNSAIFDFSVHDGIGSISSPYESGDEAISYFKVMRLHRFKLRWTANLIIRWSCFEIVPFTSEMDRRRSFLPQQYQKSTKVPWELMCNVQFSEKEKLKPSKETSYYLTFSFLSTDRTQESLDLPSESNTIPDLTESSEKHHWKSVQVECKSKEDALDIYNQVQSIINTRESTVHQAWLLSNNGALSPLECTRQFLRRDDDELTPSVNESTKVFNNPKVASLVRFLRLSKHK